MTYFKSNSCQHVAVFVDHLFNGLLAEMLKMVRKVVVRYKRSGSEEALACCDNLGVVNSGKFRLPLQIADCIGLET